MERESVAHLTETSGTFNAKAWFFLVADVALVRAAG